MLVSSSYLVNALRSKNKKETYKLSNSVNDGAETAVDVFSVILSFIIILAETVLLFYAIQSVYACTKPGKERVVNMILAVFFTSPYMLLKCTFDSCTKNSLRQ